MVRMWLSKLTLLSKSEKLGVAGIKSATPLVSITIPPEKFCRKLSFNSRIFLILLSIFCFSFKTERAGIFSDPLVKFVKLITSHSLLFLLFYIFTSSRVQVSYDRKKETFGDIYLHKTAEEDDDIPF